MVLVLLFMLLMLLVVGMDVQSRDDKMGAMLR